MQTLSPDHFQQRAREHYLRILALQEQLRGPFNRAVAEADARSIKAQLLVDRDWANSSTRVHSLEKIERTALMAICAACAALNRFKVYSDPSGWASRISEALGSLARYATYTHAHSAAGVVSFTCTSTEPSYEISRAPSAPSLPGKHLTMSNMNLNGKHQESVQGPPCFTWMI
jgi:hypothetical protein